MKNISLIILLTSLVFNSIAQSAEFGYSEEFSIWETTDFVIRDYNITIDKNNTMHMVYSADISSNFGKIYYIKSIDLGVTWTTPIDISNNQEKWTLDPHIAADNENNLYVTFSYDVGDYTNTKVVFKKFDGQNWSIGDTITENIMGATNGSIIINSENKVFCFFNCYHTVCYKIYDNNSWSELHVVVEGQEDNTFSLEKIISDSLDNFYCLIANSYSQGNYFTPKLLFCKYSNEIWNDFVQISDSAFNGSDICLDNENEPHIVWNEYLSHTVRPIQGTYYKEFANGSWLNKKLINTGEKLEYCAIACDINNNNKIVNQYSFRVHPQHSNNERLYLHYIYYYANSIWFRNAFMYNDMKIQQSANKFIKKDNLLFLFYKGRPHVDSIGRICYRTYESGNQGITTIKEKSQQIIIYPNPTNNEINIEFYLNKPEQVKIELYDTSGKLIEILSDKPGTQGNNLLTLKSKSIQRKEVNTGFYIIKLSYGENCYSQKIVFN
ncbi:MAG TPA: T9SS type A sorting domain-containing protein [Bacteroidales bacterium]|nr:T9SS type A sorting domain-containing protein [Bacteroidales bacterium]